MKKSQSTTMKNTLATIIALAAVVFFLLTSASWATEDSSNSTAATPAPSSTNNLSLKANFLENIEKIPDDKRIARNAFRQWANKPKPFGATALLCVFVAVIGLGFFPKIMDSSQESIRTSFWRCLGLALLTDVCLLILFKVFLGAKATVPLSVLLIGLYELLLLAGLAVSVCLFGNQIAKKLSLQKLSFIKSRPRLSHLVSVLIGSILIALLVQIPELGKLPPIGIRLAVLIAAVGEGGLLVHLLKKQNS